MDHSMPRQEFLHYRSPHFPMETWHLYSHVQTHCVLPASIVESDIQPYSSLFQDARRGLQGTSTVLYPRTHGHCSLVRSNPSVMENMQCLLLRMNINDTRRSVLPVVIHYLLQ